MKRCFIFLFSAFLITSCAKVNPESQLESKVFTMLTKMDSLSYQTYFNEYIDLDVYKKLAKEGNLEESYRKEILDLTEDSFSYFRRREYLNLKNRASESNIKWRDITLSGFEYTQKYERGFEWLDGYLFFDYNSQEYEVRVYTIFDGSEYHIFAIKM